MFTKEELDSWNELFPNCKIREMDLSHPTESFLTKTLIEYLRSFGYKSEPAFSIQVLDELPQTRDKRLFLIKLARSIDHILKITDKSYACTYYDLIKPTPKKTSHMLGILLNYFYYYDMYKTDVFKLTQDRLKEWQKVQQHIKETQEGNARCKEQEAKIKNGISCLGVQVSASKTELEKLNERKMSEKKEFQKFEDQIKELDRKEKELLTLERNLKAQIVSDDEARELQSQYSKFEDLIADCKAQQITNEQSLKERWQQIAILEETLKGVDKTNEVIPLKLLRDCEETTRVLKITKENYTLLADKRLKFFDFLQNQLKMLDSMKCKFLQDKQIFETELKQKLRLVTERKKQYNAIAEEMLQLKRQEHLLACEIQEQQNISTFIQEHIAEIIPTYPM